MNQRSVTVCAAAVLVLVSFSAGALFAKGEGLKRLNLAGRSDSRPFTHTVVAGETIYIAGSIGVDSETGRVPEDPMDEARLMMDSFKAKVELAGATMSDLVSVQVFCSDVTLYNDFNELYGSYFTEKGAYPVRAFIGSGALLFDARFEINGIAVKR
ncbi:MAG: RidA family protein [Acidobacteria bacterium]|nr:RidA family protein [Acidobacteriota bacterium]NIM64097.1 RidA family protein [Acidobacteriota bacterium]NIO59397.1 RidA family protein [Acidobacteriota bacterium]NIQ30431.1 RidA family protein [Acidobacteriota bacterium]NIQ85363.1 RidA family protein [Acidobacteriota bacterium]